MASKNFTKYPPKKPENHIIKPRVKHNWSDYQKAIFKNIATEKGNLLIIARAGSAKTSSLVEGSRYVPKGSKNLFCAFNKHIQLDLKDKLSNFIECFTLHSIGFRAIKLRFPNVELNNNKCWEIVETFFSNPKDNFDVIQNICKTVDFCKATLTDTSSKIEELIDEQGIDYCEMEPKEFIRYVQQALGKCKEMTTQIDFNDMIWFCIVYNLNIGKYDNVFIDESQDLSRSQIELALSAVKKDGRVIAVLDNFQEIYSWRTGGSDVLDLLRKRLSPKELLLPICYRCPKKVVALAQEIVPDIIPYENAIDGEIIDINVNDLQKYAKPGSYVLSRINAPLIKHCLKFLKNGIPANMLGRDIGDGLSYLIKKSKKKRVDAFLKWLYDWAKSEKARIIAKYPKASLETVDDKVECMENLCEGATTLDDVKKNIDELFKDGVEEEIVLFSSIHKIKGKEQNIVFVLADTLRSHSQEEKNIEYISYTRAKKVLYLVRK